MKKILKTWKKNFDELKNELDKGHVATSHEFIYGGENEHFRLAIC